MPPPMRLGIPRISGGLREPAPADVAAFARDAGMVPPAPAAPSRGPLRMVPGDVVLPDPSFRDAIGLAAPMSHGSPGDVVPYVTPSARGPLDIPDVAIPMQAPPPPTPGPILNPAFLTGAVTPVPSTPPAATSYADEPMLPHRDTMPLEFAPGLRIPDVSIGMIPPTTYMGHPSAGVRSYAEEAVRPSRPRMFVAPMQREPALPPEPPDFIDQMISRSGPTWQDTRETPFDRERRALAAATQLEQQRQEMLGAQAMNRADAEEMYRRRVEQNEQERQRAAGEARAAYVRAADRLAGMRMDPGRYYRNAGAIGMLGNAIAVGLGAMGEALGGGPNVALQQINAAIDRDIAAQEQDIATAGQDVQNRRGVLHEVQNEYSTRQGAIMASRAMMLGDLAARAEAQAASMGGAEAAARGAALRDQLLTAQEQAQAAAEAAEINGLLDLRRTVAQIRRDEARAAQEEIRARRMAGMGGATRSGSQRVTTPQMQAFDAMVAAGVNRAEAASRAGLPEGMVPPGNPITTEQRAPLDALDAALRHVESLVPAEGDVEGAGIIDTSIPNLLQSDRGLELRVAIEDMIDLYGRVRSGAAITESEREAFRRNLVGSGTERELRAGLAQLRREISARLGRGGARAGGSSMIDQAARGLVRVE